MALRRSACPEAITHLGKAIELAEGLGEGAADRLLRLRLQVAYGQAVMAAEGNNAPVATAAFLRARELAEGIENASERLPCIRAVDGRLDSRRAFVDGRAGSSLPA